MDSHVCNESPQQLARFPQEVRDAYQRFRSQHDRAAAQEVVLAALLDYLPIRGAHGSERTLRDEQRLIEDLGYDSLAIAEIVFFLEDLFGVVIKTADLKTVQTVGDLRAFVDEKLVAGLPRE
ncbi:MAG: acyl carrier protein [Opitutaceae bacterium]